MKKILITGASGFIGKHCLEFLNSKDFEIHAISTKKVQNPDNIFWHQVDLFNQAALKEIFVELKPQYLLHLAWNIADRDYDGNHHFKWLQIGINITHAFYENGGKRMVVAGSCFEYDWKNGICYEDQINEHSQHTYGYAKYTLSKIIDKYCKINNYSYAWGRIFFAYGYGGNSTSLIPYVINNLNSNKEVVIRGTNQIKDYIHIDDIAGALVKLLYSDVNGSINISTGTPMKIKNIVEKIANYLKKPQLVKFNTQVTNFDGLCVIGDNSRLINEVKYTPRIDFDKGLLNTIKEYTKISNE